MLNYLMIAASLLAQPQQFDLKCAADNTGSGLSMGKTSYFRIDLQHKTYCEGACLKTQKLEVASDVDVVFLSSKDDTNVVESIYDRTDGVWFVYAKLAGLDLSLRGRCDERQFSGFPTIP